jgi:molybdopterin/thiamine biosynthesis adenylyltransferase
VTLNLPSGVAQYGVAFACGTETQVVQFTKGEAPNPTLRCIWANAPASVNVTPNYNDSAFPATATRLYTVNTLNEAFGALTSNPETLTVSPGQGDLLVALYDTSGGAIALKGLLNQSFTAGASFSLNFAASDATSGTGNIGSYAVPSGFTTGGTNS